MSTNTYLNQDLLRRKTRERQLAGRLKRELGIIYRYIRDKKQFPTWRFTKRLNRILNDWEFDQRKTRLRSFPTVLIIDPTNTCNLRCPLCPTGQGIMPSQGKMSYETFVEIFDQFKSYAYRVWLYNWGEPLLHPDIYRMIRYVSSYDVETLISTNLSVSLKKETAIELVGSGLNTLIVSMDGITQEIYQKYRVGGKLDRVVSNLKLLVETKRKLQSESPKITIQFIAFRHNEHEIPQMQEFAQQVGADDFHIEPAILDMSKVATKTAAQPLAANVDWLPSEKDYRRYKDDKWRYDPEACRYLWNTAVFRWDGEIFPCCVVYRDEDSFGNVKQMSFSEVWNNNKYQSARALFGNPQSVDKVCSVCDVCYATEGYKVVNQ